MRVREGLDGSKDRFTHASWDGGWVAGIASMTELERDSSKKGYTGEQTIHIGVSGGAGPKLLALSQSGN